MDNSYLSAILNLINAYSLRISDYAIVLNKVSSLDEDLPQDEVSKKNNLVDNLNKVINLNIEILNILRELFTKENDAFTLNNDLIKEINERLALTNDSLKLTTEGLKLTTEGTSLTNEGKQITKEEIKSTNEGKHLAKEQLSETDEGFTITNEGKHLTKEENKTTNDVLKEIAEIIINSNYIPIPKSEEPEATQNESLPPALTSEQIRKKIIQSKGILRKPFIEHFRGKYKFDKVPVRLAFIMEDIYKNSTTTQDHIRSVLNPTRITIERAFSELRKHGWIKLKSSKQNQQYILTPNGKAFIENIVSRL
jgi:predicted transcriptional regulator